MFIPAVKFLTAAFPEVQFIAVVVVAVLPSLGGQMK